MSRLRSADTESRQAFPFDPYADTASFLQNLDVPFRRPSFYQFKIGHINYYPTTRNVVLDGHESEPCKGLPGLELVLRRERLLK